MNILSLIEYEQEEEFYGLYSVSHEKNLSL